mmetsp:Transcript_32082/g.90972  ORF Transcript_32082/g.90972 Transcript_32082/m.90972 type:complete len:325 (-) Transcript_32082:72-1046(-)
MSDEAGYEAAPAAGEVVPLSEEAEEAAAGGADGAAAPAEAAGARGGKVAAAPAGSDPAATASGPDHRSGDVSTQRRSDEPGGPPAEGEPEHKVFVGGISWQLDDKELAEVFEKYHPSGAQVMKDKFTNRSRGFGFVWFLNAEDKDAAIADLHKQMVGGREISVTSAIPQSQTAPGTPAAALGGAGRRGGDRAYGNRYADRGRYGDRGTDYRSSYDRGYGGGSRGYGGYDRRDMGGYGDPYARSYDAYGGYERGYEGYDRYGGGYGRQPYAGGGYGDRGGYDDRYGSAGYGAYADRSYGGHGGPDRSYTNHRGYGSERDNPYARR